MKAEEIGTIIEIDFKEKKKILSFQQRNEWIMLAKVKPEMGKILESIYHITKSRQYTDDISVIFLNILSELERRVEKLK